VVVAEVIEETDQRRLALARRATAGDHEQRSRERDDASSRHR
jgi:hypothetical protein